VHMSGSSSCLRGNARGITRIRRRQEWARTARRQPRRQPSDNRTPARSRAADTFRRARGECEAADLSGG
jgi:hypothetical protein